MSINTIASLKLGDRTILLKIIAALALMLPSMVHAQIVIVEDFEAPPGADVSGYDAFSRAFPPGTSQLENSNGTAGFFTGPNPTLAGGTHLTAVDGERYSGLHSNGRFTQEVLRIDLQPSQSLVSGRNYELQFLAYQLDLGIIAGSEFQHPGYFDFFGIRSGQANPTNAQQASSGALAAAGYDLLGATPLIDHVTEWRDYAIRFTAAQDYDRMLIVPRSRTGARGDSAYLGIDRISYSVETDLVTEKTLASGSASVLNGDPVSFQIEVTNNGPFDATNVVLTDQLPAGISPTAGNGAVTSGTYTAATGVWSLPTLAVGDSATLTLVGTVDADQPALASIQNVTSAAAGDQPDPSTVGDDLTESVTVQSNPLLTMTKEADDDELVTVGQTVTYTYRVTNTGNEIIRGVTVSDVHNGSGAAPVPGDEALDTDNLTANDSSDGTPDDGIWDVLGPGDIVTFTGTYIVTQDDIDNLQ